MAGGGGMTIEELVRKVLVDDNSDVIREPCGSWSSSRWSQRSWSWWVQRIGERRREARATHRYGYRPRQWDTRAGEIELQIPKFRQGSYFPSFLQPTRARSRRWCRWCSRRMCAGS